MDVSGWIKILSSRRHLDENLSHLKNHKNLYNFWLGGHRKTKKDIDGKVTKFVSEDHLIFKVNGLVVVE